MPEYIDGFSQVEYLSVFFAILFGVVAAEFFTGWGKMLRHRANTKMYWLHFLWTIFAFLTLIQNWYGIWPRTEYINDNFLYFLYSLVPMFVFHLITVALFPEVRAGEKVDFKKYYDENSSLLLILFAVYFSLAVSSSFIYPDKGDVLEQNFLRIGGVIFALSCAYFNKKRWLQILFLGISFLALIDFILAIPT